MYTPAWARGLWRGRKVLLTAVQGGHIQVSFFNTLNLCGLARRCYLLVDGDMKPHVVKRMSLAHVGQQSIHQEYSMLQAVKDVQGVVSVVRQPIFSQTDGSLLLE